MAEEQKIRIWFSDESYTIINSISELSQYDDVVSMEYM